MATYKVIQDIEAEDKLIGPLTLRQSIYGGVAAICGYISFVVASKGLSLLLVIFLPPTLFAAFFAFPWGRDQSTEIWALAKIRFFLKSRRRIWDQVGVKDLVTITAPKKEFKRQTNGLSEHEVQSRLTALASTLDTRGWAVKNVYNIPPLMAPVATDRLLDMNNLPQQVQSSNITNADDIMDSDNNARAHQLQEMVTAATTSHKQELLERMRQGAMPSLPAPAPDTTAQWFTASPVNLPAAAVPIEVNETVLSGELHERKDINGNEHLKTIAPIAPEPVTTMPSVPFVPPQDDVTDVTTSAPDPATIHLSQRDDLNISTIARIAKGEDSSNEVVISLH